MCICLHMFIYRFKDACIFYIYIYMCVWLIWLWLNYHTSTKLENDHDWCWCMSSLQKKKLEWSWRQTKTTTWKFAADYIEPLHFYAHMLMVKQSQIWTCWFSQGLVISPINITIGGSPCLDNTNQNSQTQSKPSPNCSQVPTPRNALVRLSVPLPGVLALL